MKRILLLLSVTTLLLSGCNMFRLHGDHARHAYLNKVPVNSTQTVADVVVPEPIDTPEDAIINFTEPKSDVASTEVVVEKNTSTTAKSHRLERIIDKVQNKHLTTAFKSQAKAHVSEDQNYIDPVTLLVWVVVIALILIILGVVIPGILDIVLALLLVMLLVMAILYLAGNM